MFFMYKMASEIDFALKNIQAKTVNPNVSNINESSFRLGNNLPLATVSRLLRLLLVNKRGKK